MGGGDIGLSSSGASWPGLANDSRDHSSEECTPELVLCLPHVYHGTYVPAPTHTNLYIMKSDMSRYGVGT